MKYAQLNKNGTFNKELPEGNIEWDENNYCTVEALIKDGKADQFKVVPLLETAPPTINPITESVSRDGAEKVNGQWQYKWKVTKLPTEQVNINQANQDKEDYRKIQEKINSLWAAADKYTSNYISGVAIGILTIGVMQNKPKALAVSTWSQSIWSEYYTRKALITPNSVDNFDFSSFGPIPYSIPELQAEIAI